MKRGVCTAACWGFPWLVLGFDFTPYQEMGVMRSAPSNGLYAVVTGVGNPFQPHSGYVTKASENLTVGFLTTESVPCLLDLPWGPERMCRIEMTDSSGRRVWRTWRGWGYGSGFDTALSRFDANHCTAGSAGQESDLKEAAGRFGGLKFEAPQGLFRMRRPGRYLLKLTFQVWKVDANNKVVPVRLPVVELPVEKEAGQYVPPWGWIVVGVSACALGVGWLVVRRTKGRSVVREPPSDAMSAVIGVIGHRGQSIKSYNPYLGSFLIDIQS